MAKVILLAAGRGKRFGKQTKITPKCLIPLGYGETHLLARYLSAFKALKLSEAVLVVGHQKHKIIAECAKHGAGLALKFIINPEYRKGSIVSLYQAAHELNEDCLIMDADVFFDPASVKKLLKAKISSFMIDPRSKFTGEEMMLAADKTGRPVRIAKDVNPTLKTLGEAVGFFFVKKNDGSILRSALKKLIAKGLKNAEYEDSYNEFMKKKRVGWKNISGFWTEMDFEEDRNNIMRYLRKKQASA